VPATPRKNATKATYSLSTRAERTDGGGRRVCPGRYDAGLGVRVILDSDVAN